MRKIISIKIAIYVWLCFAAVLNGRAATNIVLNSDDLQAAINAASPGDTLVLQPGTYMQNLVFTNPLTFLCGVTAISNQPVNLGGTVQIQGAGASFFQQITFMNSVGVQCTGTVSFVKCLFQNPVTTFGATLLSSSNTFQSSVAVDLSTGATTNLQAYDTSFGTLTINGGKALLKRCQITGAFAGPWVQGQCNVSGSSEISLGLTGTSLEAIRLTTSYGIDSTAGGGAPITIVQSQVGQSGLIYVISPVILASNKVWMGYSSVFGAVQLSGCDSVLIGNSVWADSLPGWQWGSPWEFGDLQCSGGTLRAYNNLFVAAQPGTCIDPLVQLNSLASGGAEFVNNTFYQNYSSTALSADNTFPVTLRGDAIYGSLSGGSALWDISYCVFNTTPSVGAPFACIVSDPGFVNPGNSGNPPDFWLKTNSVCIGNGPVSPIYNNRGTTNRCDIGFTGGPFYNPANCTNTQPIAFLLTGTPQAGKELIFPIGRTNIMTLNAAAAAGN